MKNSLLFLFFLFSISSSLFAQTEVVDSLIVEQQSELEYDTTAFFGHKVQVGETAYSLKKQYGITLEELFEINPNAKFGIVLGEQILIPKKDTSNLLPEKKVPKLKPGQYVYHIVKQSEGFFGIAQLYAVSIADIKAANPDIQTLQSGQRLIIPFDITIVPEEIPSPPTPVFGQNQKFYTAKPKETIWGISHRFNISEEALIFANPSLSDGLKVGQVILIPDEEYIAAKEKEIEDAKEDLSKETPGYHVVEAGETLYRIAKKYRVSVDSLYSINPTLSEDISPGQLIAIPEYKNNFNFIEHHPQRKERLSEIAYKYQVNFEELKKLNPRVPKRVSRGDIVLIPIEKRKEVEKVIIPKEEEDFTVDTMAFVRNCKKQLNVETTFNVALLLPLNSRELDSATFDNIEHNSNLEDYPFFKYIQFVEGAKLAIDSLAKRGMRINLIVFDVSKDVEKTRELLERPAMQQADLIIGLLYSRTFEIVADFSRKNNIPLVNALSKRSSILDNSPSVFKVTPSEEVLPEIAVNILPKNQQINLILVRPDKYRESIRMTKLEEEVKKWSEENADNLLSLSMLNYMEDGSTGIIEAADTVGLNYIIAVSEDELFAMDLLRTTSEYSDSLGFRVIAYPYWNSFNQLETQYIQQLKLHFIADEFVDYSLPYVQNFVDDFRVFYNVEPNKYAFLGYDLSYYFVQALGYFGNDFTSCLNSNSYRSLQNGYVFEKKENGGWENVFWNRYMINNYRRIPIMSPSIKSDLEESIIDIPEENLMLIEN